MDEDQVAFLRIISNSAVGKSLRVKDVLVMRM